MMGHSASLVFALATMAAGADTEVDTLSHGQCPPGQQFEIRTADQIYRGAIVNPAAGECRLATSTDGKTFSDPHTVYLVGATAGRQQQQMLVLMREVKVGWRMELGWGDLDEKHRQVTSEVKSIKRIR